MAPIKVIKNKFQVDIRINGKRCRKRFNTHAEAVIWENIVKLTGAPPAEPKPLNKPVKQQIVPADSKHDVTLKEAFDACYNRFWADSKNEYKARLNGEKMLEFFGDSKLLVNLKLEDVDSWIGYLKKTGNAESTINRKVAVLTKILGFAHKRGWIENYIRVERFKETEGRLRWFTVKEEKLILEYLNTNYPDVADFVTVLLDTGLRCGECLKIQWVDWTGDNLTVPERKAGNTSTLPLTARVKNILKRRRCQEVGPFHSLQSRSQIRTAWRYMRKSLGMTSDPEFVIHACRHTFISRLIQRGVSIRVVQQLAGHKTLTMTMRYAHLAPENLKEAIKTLE